MKFIHFLIFAVSLLFIACSNNNGKSNEKNAPVSVKAINDSPAMAQPETKAAQPYRTEVAYNSIKFVVNSPGLPSGNSFTITSSGLTEMNVPVTEQMEGLVTEVLIDDMDADDSPELGIITRQGDKVKIYLYSANKNKTMSSVYLPEISDAKLLAGFKGQDAFAFVEGRFIQRFPLYDGDIKTGKMRQLQYKLRPGEASKKMVLDRTIDF